MRPRPPRDSAGEDRADPRASRKGPPPTIARRDRCSSASIAIPRHAGALAGKDPGGDRTFQPSPPGRIAVLRSLDQRGAKPRRPQPPTEADMPTMDEFAKQPLEQRLDHLTRTAD